MGICASNTVPNPLEEGETEGRLFNKIVLYTTPFYDMEEIPEGGSYIDFVRELRKDSEDRAVSYYRGTETQRRRAGAATLYTAAEAVQWKKKATECEICKKVFDSQEEKHGDHDHTTGKWRGVLCSTCNTGIGMLKDSPDLCEAAAAYLRNAKL